MFTLTRDWLFKYYGSTKPGQEEDTRSWFVRYAKDFPRELLNEWSQWKHFSEYQPNCTDNVNIALSKIGTEFETELQCHRFMNLLRVPLAQAYLDALQACNPTSILELGVGGDSGISTAMFLSHVEKKQNGFLESVDRNNLGMTETRYEQYKGSLWSFSQSDSEYYLKKRTQESKLFDMIFIDTSHIYPDTYRELELASKITDWMLMDDAKFAGNEGDAQPGGVKRSIEEWGEANKGWNKTELWHGNVVLFNKIKQPVKKTGRGKK
jgi:predicted O-methyltransferase YrrM